MNNFWQWIKNKKSSLVKALKSDSRELFFLRLSNQERILFAKRLSLLVKAGVPILSGLQMLKNSTKSRTTIKIMEMLATDVENGQFLSASLSKFKRVFGEFAINIIQVGEISGTLHENLNYLAEELKKEQVLKRKIKSAMVYPIFIILATFGITILLTVFVFPKILPIFKSVNFDLPWTTRLLILLSALILNHWFLIIASILMLIVGVWLLLRIQSVRLLTNRNFLRLPIIGRISQGYNIANICRTLGLLMKSGVGIVEATKITAKSTVNLAYKRELEEMATNITRGEKFSTHMNRLPGLFPSIMSQMVLVGESTGNLSETLTYLAEMYEAEVDDLTKNLSTVIEPVLLIFMGLIVGFVAISIITPIYGITQHLTPK